jgi:hypothetical protein
MLALGPEFFPFRAMQTFGIGLIAAGFRDCAFIAGTDFGWR